MKKVIKNIFVLSILIVFTLSYMGISIHEHYCDTCKISQTYVFSHPVCCHTHEIKHNNDNTCCGELGSCNLTKNSTESHERENTCCSDNTYYFKADFEFVTQQNVKAENPVKWLTRAFFIDFFALTTENGQSDFKLSFYVPPPLPLKGTEFLLFSHQLVFYERV